MNDFISVIEDFILLFKDLIQIEETKLEAASKNRVTYVEDCMNKEQAAILRLRGLEKRRETVQEKLGFKGYTFQQILSETTGEDQDRLRKLFDTLSRQVRQFQDTNESARSMIEINLHMINKAINNSQNGTVAGKAKWEGLL
jgi:DNA integrity scanning protein DisA with diadenylate cyclase activity